MKKNKKMAKFARKNAAVLDGIASIFDLSGRSFNLKKNMYKHNIKDRRIEQSRRIGVYFGRVGHYITVAMESEGAILAGKDVPVKDDVLQKIEMLPKTKNVKGKKARVPAKI